MNINNAYMPMCKPNLSYEEKQHKKNPLLRLLRENFEVLLLCILKMRFKQICIYTIRCAVAGYVLSEFPKRIASVSTVGTPSLTSAVVVYTQLLSLPIFSLRIISGVTKT
jgi:hypothetical protein